MKNHPWTTKLGITLTELLIALVMTGIVFAVALSIYTSSLGILRNTMKVQSDNVTQAPEIAMETLIRDFQTANKITYFPGLEFFSLRRDCNCAEVPNNTPWDLSDDTNWWYGTDPFFGGVNTPANLRKGGCNEFFYLGPGSRVIASNIGVTQATGDPLFAVRGAPGTQRIIELQIYPTPTSGQKRVRTHFTVQSIREFEEAIFGF